jgi:hypothetical protein
MLGKAQDLFTESSGRSAFFQTSKVFFELYMAGKASTGRNLSLVNGSEQLK